jgi:hypothetical protein
MQESNIYCFNVTVFSDVREEEQKTSVGAFFKIK